VNKAYLAAVLDCESYSILYSLFNGEPVEDVAFMAEHLMEFRYMWPLRKAAER